MKHIIHLSFGSSALNGEHLLEFGGETIRLTRLGADQRFDLFLHWIKESAGHCDIVALSQLPPPFRGKHKTYQHDTLTQSLKALGDQPYSLGFLVQDLYGTWALEHCLKTGAIDLQRSHFTIISGLWEANIKRALASRTSQIHFLDPWSLLGIKASIKGPKSFDRWSEMTIPALTKLKPQWTNDHRTPLEKSQAPWLKNALEAETFIGCASLLTQIDRRILKNKTIFTDEMTPEMVAYLKDAQVYNAYASQFNLGGSSLKTCEVEALAMLDLKTRKHRKDCRPTMAEVIDFVDKVGLKPQIEALYPERQLPLRKFAFIIHPLSQEQLFYHPATALLKPLPGFAKNQMEKWINLVPGVRYGTISGIVSESTGVHTEGLIYAVFGTPRQLLDSDPETIYRQLVQVAEHAASQGAQIIGLGAFTKIVGDAGVTVAARSPIPVTTGNSLSAAATLWAARDACRKLGFVKFDKSKSPVTQGRAMVIGATGSIGKACAKLLSKLFSEVILTATNGPRLFQLKEEILEESPDTIVHVTTQPSKFAPESDVIVISTSATAGGILDLKTVKPGCVICDVSRPLTFKPYEATERPDVLIIESGEIELPGQIKIDCDIGLPDATVYACLAETAILALEGRYETYTLSRDISTNKVIEIYKMTKKHGGRLAAIRGPQGLITDLDIDLCRQHALKKMEAHAGSVLHKSPSAAEPESSSSIKMITSPEKLPSQQAKHNRVYKPKKTPAADKQSTL